MLHSQVSLICNKKSLPTSISENKIIFCKGICFYQFRMHVGTVNEYAKSTQLNILIKFMKYSFIIEYIKYIVKYLWLKENFIR